MSLTKISYSGQKSCSLIPRLPPGECGSIGMRLQISDTVKSGFTIEHIPHNAYIRVLHAQSIVKWTAWSRDNTLPFWMLCSLRVASYIVVEEDWVSVLLAPFLAAAWELLDPFNRVF